MTAQQQPTAPTPHAEIEAASQGEGTYRASPTADRDGALRHLAAAAAAYARTSRAAGRRGAFPTTRLFVCAHDDADVEVVRDDVALALCPACAALFTAGALRFAEMGMILLPNGG